MKRVYVITNQVNGKHYVGITTQNVKQRWAEHMYRFRSGDRDHKLYLAMRKYGVENFICLELPAIPDQCSLAEQERLLIAKLDSYNNGYNMTPGGDEVSPETAKKISDALSGRKHTAEHHRKMWASRKANPDYVSPGERVKQNPNASAKYWTIQHPNGRVEIVHNLNTFCKQHSLSFNLMLAVLKGWQTHHKGFVLLARSNDYPEMEYSQAAGNSTLPEDHKLVVNVGEFD